jgi:hypothetical protein
MNTLRALLQTLVATLLSLSLSASSHGASPVPIVNINPSMDVPKPFPGFDEAHGDGLVGWNFQLLVPFTITHVGWYDQDADGLSRAFQVGLWQTDPGLPPFWGWDGSSLIGDPVNGLIIPTRTKAALVGVWRVVDLTEPLMLQPGFYQLGGLDSRGTADVIKYVEAGSPQSSTLTPPGSPVAIEAFFYAQLPGIRTNFGSTTSSYAAWGLELGPMVFGAKSAPPSTGSELSIRRISSAPSSSTPSRILLTWPSGTLMEADVVTGPYTAVPYLDEKYFLTPSPAPLQKFYRLSP